MDNPDDAVMTDSTNTSTMPQNAMSQLPELYHIKDASAMKQIYNWMLQIS